MNKTVKSGHSSLKARSFELYEGEDVAGLVAQMKQVMSTWGGIGLAANQIDCLQRVIVVKVGSFKQVIINPVITRRYGGKSTEREECLSHPGVISLVIRDKQIVVEGFDENWKPVKFKLKKLASRCVQHEVDHLDGVSIVDIESKRVNFK